MNPYYTYIDPNPVSGVQFHLGDTTTESYHKLYNTWGQEQHVYLPLLSVSLKAHILATTTRTTLTQTFHNPSKHFPIPEAKYTFPLYANCCVLSFVCHIGDTKVITGVVQPKEKAKETYNNATRQGQTAGLLEQNTTEAFTTQLGNIPPGATVTVEIGYITELKHDSEADGIRFTVPTSIAPRYGVPPPGVLGDDLVNKLPKGIEFSVEVTMAENIRSIESTSHPISVLLGTHGSSSAGARGKSEDKGKVYDSKKALATLFQPESVLNQDFVLMITTVTSHFLSLPQALLETHPTIPNQQALMVTLVPRFNAPASSKKPDLIFLVDRSGSMGGKMASLKSALRVFLKSLPVGCRFNIVSFGSSYSFLWPQPQDYTRESLGWAENHIEGFDSDLGGTDILPAMTEIVKRREIPEQAENNMEIMVLTDGEIWGLDVLLNFVGMARQQSKGQLRFFSLGIGHAISHALVEGIAQMGGGFSQVLGPGEEHSRSGALEGKVVRMLNGALSDHTGDYKIEVVYEGEGDMSADDSDESGYTPPSSNGEGGGKSHNTERGVPRKSPSPLPLKRAKTVTLFDETASPHRVSPKPEEKLKGGNFNNDSIKSGNPFSHLKDITGPETLQAPFKIPTLFPFERSVVYLLLPPSKDLPVPKSVVLRATGATGVELVLPIPVTKVGSPGTTIHQLGARMILRDLEQGQSWIHSGNYGVPIDESPEKIAEYVEREGERISLKWGLASKWTSFVAIEEEILCDSSTTEVFPQAIDGPGNHSETSDESMTDFSTDGDTTINTPPIPTPIPTMHSLVVLPRLPEKEAIQGPRISSQGVPSSLMRTIKGMQVIQPGRSKDSWARMLNPRPGGPHMDKQDWALLNKVRSDGAGMDSSRVIRRDSRQHTMLSETQVTRQATEISEPSEGRGKDKDKNPPRGSPRISAFREMCRDVPAPGSSEIQYNSDPSTKDRGRDAPISNLFTPRLSMNHDRAIPYQPFNEPLGPTSMGCPTSPVYVRSASPIFKNHEQYPSQASERFYAPRPPPPPPRPPTTSIPTAPCIDYKLFQTPQASLPPIPKQYAAVTTVRAHQASLLPIPQQPAVSPEIKCLSPPGKVYTPLEKVLALIKMQTFDGSYSYTTELVEIMEPLDATAVTEFMKLSSAHATALVAVYLSHTFGEFRDLWSLIVNKAWGFVEGAGGRTELEKQAMKIITASSEETEVWSKSLISTKSTEAHSDQHGVKSEVGNEKVKNWGNGKIGKWINEKRKKYT